MGSRSIGTRHVWVYFSVVQDCLVSHLLEQSDGIVRCIAVGMGDLFGHFTVWTCGGSGGSFAGVVLDDRRPVQSGVLHLFSQAVQGSIIALKANCLNRSMWLRLLLRNRRWGEGGLLLLLRLLLENGLLLDNGWLLLDDGRPLGCIVVAEDMLLQRGKESALALLWWVLRNELRLRAGLRLRYIRLDRLTLGIGARLLKYWLGSSCGGGDPGGLARSADGRNDGGDTVDSRRLGGGLCSGDWVHDGWCSVRREPSGTR
ncbi:MAG: hypothetical protein J3R72DRAFT_258061 [Linnemannia gamsii]|nr:MAG: hypothetical protein J3R72DRAFT_258061 [Linnemannia gamsii]